VSFFFENLIDWPLHTATASAERSTMDSVQQRGVLGPQAPSVPACCAVQCTAAAAAGEQYEQPLCNHSVLDTTTDAHG
jgi:hypothetical protein